MFHMLDQCYTISHKLCPKKITKHTTKSTKCQQQSKSVNSIMFYSGKYNFVSFYVQDQIRVSTL